MGIENLVLKGITLIYEEKTFTLTCPTFQRYTVNDKYFIIISFFPSLIEEHFYFDFIIKNNKGVSNTKLYILHVNY